MKDFLLRSKRAIPVKLSDSDGHDRIFIFFVISILGIFFGSMAAGSVFYRYRLVFSDLERWIFEVSFLMVLLFFSTSYLGTVALPGLIFLKYFFVSVFISSAFVYSGGSFRQAVVCESVPAFILMPCSIILAADCMSQSYSLFALRFGRCQHRPDRRMKFHLFFCIFFCLVDFFYCIYIIPRL